MGHKELSTTDRYVHLSKRHLCEAQSKIERYRAEREIAEAEEMKATESQVSGLLRILRGPPLTCKELARFLFSCLRNHCGEFCVDLLLFESA